MLRFSGALILLLECSPSLIQKSFLNSADAVCQNSVSLRSSTHAALSLRSGEFNKDPMLCLISKSLINKKQEAKKIEIISF